jgi:hypothetical protein
VSHGVEKGASPTESHRIRRVERIIVRKYVRLIRLRDIRVNTQELIGRWIVVPIDRAFFRGIRNAK